MLGKNKISYTIRKSKRAKRVRLVVYCDGSVVVTHPLGVSLSNVERFVADKTQWIMDKINYFQNTKRKPVRVFSHSDYVKHKDEALNLIKERIEFYNQIYNYSFNKIFIKNQKTRWGSCSKKGNLSLNYKIMFLPESMRDYIIVHEICHLAELNHSPKFWELVARTFPNYREIKKALRRHELVYR